MIYLLIAPILIITIYLIIINISTNIKEYEVKNDKIPDEFNNYKISHISDFHNLKSKRRQRKISSEVNKTNILVITGDMVDSSYDKLDNIKSFLKQITIPIYYVDGNHEKPLKAYSAYIKMLNSLNVNIVNNIKEDVIINNKKISIYGLKDPSFEASKLNKEVQNKNLIVIRNRLSKFNFDENTFNILLSHRPEAFNTYSKYPFDLVLSGHAHGALLKIGKYRLFSPNQGFNPKYAGGLYELNNTLMIVSEGLNNSGISFRINVKPTLVIVKLNNSKDKYEKR